jgi:rod shape-determining protein MreB
LKNATGLPVYIAEDPLNCVANGTGKVLEESEKFKHVWFKQE